MPPSKLTRFFEQFLFLSIRRPLPPVVQFAIATAAIVLVALVRVLFVTVLLPWLLFMPAILLLALAFGRNVGLYATFLSAHPTLFQY